MTIPQIEYIIAVADFNSFSKAAEHCCVTQPSLSIQITNLENELNMQLFDRKSKPIKPTGHGEEIIQQARIVLKEWNNLKSLSKGYSSKVAGTINVGIIPTIAPYLVPKFLSTLNKAYPELQVIISELTTDQIRLQLIDGKLDLGVLVTPLQESLLQEIPIYYEELLLYSNVIDNGKIMNEIQPEKLWLLEEGHCLSNQINFICSLRNLKTKANNFIYKSGSLETIIRLAKDANGQTIVPLMVQDYLPEDIKNQIFSILPAQPYREVSIVHSHSFVRKAILKVIIEEIKKVVPKEWTTKMERNIIPI
ncbi:MAG: hypothetical protein RI995_720 [Bacteroidota bacterium]|jgi:LysR family hydrogen peroxide-inducible transcriptional activator